MLDKINIITFLVSLTIATIVAYYSQTRDKNKLENFLDYIYFIFEKIYLVYVVILITTILTVIFTEIIDNSFFLKDKGWHYLKKSTEPSISVVKYIKGIFN